MCQLKTQAKKLCVLFFPLHPMRISNPFSALDCVSNRHAGTSTPFLLYHRQPTNTSLSTLTSLASSSSPPSLIPHSPFGQPLCKGPFLCSSPRRAPQSHPLHSFFTLLHLYANYRYFSLSF